MLSLFPALLSWGQLSPFLIRLTLGGIFLYWTIHTYKKSAWDMVANIEGLIGVFIIMGVYTQGAAAAAAIDLIIRLAGKIRHRQFLTDGANYYLLLLVMALSLLVTGAGFYAFDLPL